MKWNVCSVNAQSLDGTTGSGRCVNAACQGATAAQRDISSPDLGSLMLAVWFWQCGAQMLPQGPSKAVQYM